MSTPTGRKKTVAIVPSAGMGRRMGTVKKTAIPISGVPVLAHTLRAFEEAATVDSVVLVVPAEDIDRCREEVVSPYGLKKVTRIVAGGEERQHSVANGIRAAGRDWDIIVVHDGARPLVTPEIIDATVEEAARFGAALAAVPVKDTIKVVSEGAVKKTLPREELWSVQTPQAFSLEILEAAHEKAAEDGFLGTDESSLAERLGVQVRIIMGSYENIKITTVEDITIAECILRGRSSGVESGR